VTNIIRGKEIFLKPVERCDIEQLREWRNSEDVSSHMLSKAIISQEQQEQWYKAICKDPSVLHWVIMSKEGVKLGVASLTKIGLEPKSAEPGLYIGDKKYRNSFFGMEAYYYLLDYGFRQLQLEKISGTVLFSNETALKMNASFGFSMEYMEKKLVEIEGIETVVCKLFLNKADFYLSKMATFFSRRK